VKSYAEENTKLGLSIRTFIELDPQLLNRISIAFPPLLHRFIAGYPHMNPQIFRAFSASFAHWLVREFFLSLCAGIAQELADGAGEKKGERKAKSPRCGKTRAADRGPRYALVFHPGTWNSPSRTLSYER
jgi:hypothetical protein